MSYQNLVDAFFANGGKVTKIETGATSENRYIWCEEKRDLVQIEGADWSWRNQMKAQATSRINARRKRPDMAIAAARRERVKELAATMSQKEIAEAIGSNVDLVGRDLKALGMKAQPGKHKVPTGMVILEEVRAYMKRFPHKREKAMLNVMLAEGHQTTLARVRSAIRKIESDQE